MEKQRRIKSDCRGSGETYGAVLNAPRRGIRITCPECRREYAATFRALGPRGSCSGVGVYVPQHASSSSV
jgi:hypothetical protein